MNNDLMPYQECPSFIRCSAPLCPLDPDIKSRVKLPNEEKCRANKPTRMKIGSKYPELLPYGGLTKRQFLGRKHWENKTEEEKAAQKKLFLTTREKWQKSPKTKSILGIAIFFLSLFLISSVWADEIDFSILAKIESNNNPKAISYKNCIGTYQISTAVLYEYNTYNKTEFTQMDLFYHDTNYRIARWYISERIPQMLKWYNKPVTIDNILWSYNAGIGNLVKGIRPKETRNYIKRYMKLYKPER